MTPTYEPSDLLSIAQAAQALGVSIWTVYRRAKNNLVDSVEIAGRTYIPKSEVERLKAEGLPFEKPSASAGG